jgi:glycine cleavage system pyridoxal-binding protein P
MEFIPNTAAQQQEMLALLGLTRADLFRDIPPELVATSFHLPPRCASGWRSRPAKTRPA